MKPQRGRAAASGRTAPDALITRPEAFPCTGIAFV